MKEKSGLEIKIEEFDMKIEALETLIKDMETSLSDKICEIAELKEKQSIVDEKNWNKKKNIIERLVELEKINCEKDNQILLLTERIELLEHKNKTPDSQESDNPCESFQCEYCDFVAKNQRGLQLHIKAKHEVKKVELNVLCQATDEYLSIDRDEYKKEIETEIDVLEDVIEIFINASDTPKTEYVGKLLPTKIVIRTRIPAACESIDFRKKVWQRINNRISKGKISEE